MNRLLVAAIAFLVLVPRAEAQVRFEMNLLGTKCEGVGPSPDAVLRVADVNQALALEARSSSLEESMAIKTAALARVKTLSDFELLTRNPHAGRSDSYDQAVSRFIEAHIDEVPVRDGDLPALRWIEERTRTVSAAMTVKRAGLPAVCSVATMSELLKPSAPNVEILSYRELLASFATDVGEQYLKKARATQSR